MHMVGLLIAGFTVMGSAGCHSTGQGYGKVVLDETPPENPVKLVINLTNVPDEAVLVATAIFPDEKTYLTEEGARYSGKTERTDAFNGVARIVIDNMEEGYYAVSVLADSDGDERMSVNFLGLPREYYGFSNNVAALLGPPSFEDAMVKITPPVTELDIRFVAPPTTWGSED